MPFLAKMSAHFRGGSYSAKDPRSKSIYTHDEDYYPLKHERRLHTNTDTIIEYDDDYHNQDENDDLMRKSSSNEHSQRVRREDNEDVDWLYRKSKEKFASWDIRDLEVETNSTDKRTSHFKIGKRNPREVADVEEIFVNGDSSSPSARKRNGISREQERSSSVTRRASESFDRQNGKSRGRRTAESWSEEEDDGSPRTKFEERAKPVKNGDNRDQLLKEIETFGSLKKRNEKNAGLNLGFRAIVDKFKTKSDDKDKRETQKNRKQELVDDSWQYDNGERRSPEKFEAYPPKESKTERNHRIKDPEYELRSRRSPSEEEDHRQSRGRHHESDRSKRRSYAFEVSPDDFDVRIEKYERVRRDDPEMHRRNSFHNRGRKDSDGSQRLTSRDCNGGDVIRNTSLRDKDKVSLKRCESTKSKPPKSRVSERHSRPLTPPMDQQPNVLTNFREDLKDSPRKSFSMKEWYESNRQFAAKYLKDHSKIKELSTSDVSAKDEFVFDSPKGSRTLFGIENSDRRSPKHIRKKSFEEDINKTEGDKRHGGYRNFYEAEKTHVEAEEDSMKRRSRRRTEESTNGRRRRHRRESIEDEEEEEEDEEEAVSRRSENYGRSFVMPSRKIWNYRDGV